MVAIPQIPSELLKESRIDGLPGRVLEIPSQHRPHTLPILLIYGHHSSLERMLSTARAFSEYGPVTIPDLPGFGGMPSLTTIKKAPTIDNLADYLADFIRWRFPHGEPFILEGLSLGFVLAVRMLQRHPALAPQVRHLVSIVGFAHENDFRMDPRRRRRLARVAQAMARRPVAALFSGLILRKPFIAGTYHVRSRSHPKMKGYTWQERQDLIDFETILWKTNEVRTYFTTMSQMLRLDLTSKPLPMPVEHVAVANDQYFDNDRIAAHLGSIFTEVHVHKATLPNHAPTVLEDPSDAKALIPNSLTHIFNPES